MPLLKPFALRKSLIMNSPVREGFVPFFVFFLGDFVDFPLMIPANSPEFGAIFQYSLLTVLLNAT